MVSFPIPSRESTLHIRIRDDFGLSYKATLPAIGSASRGLRITSEEWNASRDALTLTISGLPGSTHELAVWNPGQIVSVEGGQIAKDDEGREVLRVTFAGPIRESYTSSKVIVHFGKR